MNFENLKKNISKCNRCGKKIFWNFPTLDGVKGFYGDKDYIFVATQPHFGEFPKNPNDYRFYRNLKEYGFAEAHITDLVKCRGEKGKVLYDTEVDNCIGWLDEEIKIVNPKAIIVLGDKATKALSNLIFQTILFMTYYSVQFNDDEFQTLRYLLASGKYQHGMKIKNFIIQEQRNAEEERKRYCEFNELLNKVSGEGKITAEVRRDLASQWRNATLERREWLILHLKELQGKGAS